MTRYQLEFFLIYSVII